jgi:putative transposase
MLLLEAGGPVMKKSRFTETEIVYAVKQAEAGLPVREVARNYGGSEKAIYAWRNKYEVFL